MNKRIVLLIGTVIFLLSIVFVVVLFSNNTNPSAQNPSAPPPHAELESRAYEILQILPPQNETIHLPSQFITVVFTKPTDPSSVAISISPNSSYIIKQGDNENTVIIDPQPFWNDGTTTITIQPSTTSNEGELLNKTHTFTITTGIPTPTEEEWLIY